MELTGPKARGTVRAMTKKDAVKYFGSQSAIARALGIRPHAVSQWSDIPPLLRQYQIQSATRGKLRADDGAAGVNWTKAS